MRLADAVQWLFLGLIAAGCFLISLRVGLIATGILGIVGSTAQELARAIAARKRSNVRDGP